MDVNEARQITVSAQEQMSREQAEVLSEQQSIEQTYRDEVLAAVVETRGRIDAAIIEAAQEGKVQVAYNYTVHISASRNSPEEVSVMKTRASEVVTGVLESLSQEGFLQHRGEPRDERDIRDNIDAPPEYHTIPLRVFWPSSAR